MVVKRIDRGGTSLSYVLGGGKRGGWIFLIHGAGSNASTWFRSTDALKGFRWMALDTRGHGRSGGTPDIAATADDIIAIADKEGIRRFSLAGICRGGTIALDIARRHPQRVNTIIILSPFDGPLTRCSLFVRMLCYAVRVCTRIAPQRRGVKTVDFTRPPRIPFLLTPLRDLQGIHTRHYCASALDSLDTTTHFEGVKAPLLIITGKKDIFLRRGLLRRRLAAHDAYDWIEVDSNHHVLTWRPADVGKHIAAFLRKKR